MPYLSNRKTVSFDDIASKYDQWEETPLGALTSRIERNTILSLFEKAHCRGPVLDIGCGTGNYVLIFAQRADDVYGVDISGNMLEVAQLKAKKAGVDVKFTQADARRLPFPENSFATVTCLFVIEFTKQQKEVIREIYRVLWPGGHLILSTLNRYSLWAILRRIKGRFQPTVYNDSQFLSLREVERLLLESGFSCLVWQRAVYYPPVNSPNILIHYKLFEFLGQTVLPGTSAFLAVRALKE
ncbi:MAG: class I SAM-dependent methyltransferase [Bacillota bacterium]